MSAEKRSNTVKLIARELGFMQCGIAEAKPLNEDAKRLEQWLSKGYHGTMQYMERNFELRIDPTKLVPQAKSVITVLYNYFPSTEQQPNAPKIARYAFGADYHEVIRVKLNELLFRLRATFGAIEGRGFVDSAPVLERAWAVRSGIGWVGKNANLLHKKSGSFFFIATLITDLVLTPDVPFATDHCGTCTRCIDACPTQAIISPQEVDARKCIAYLTIEWKGEQMPEGYEQRSDNWLFGCDVCQEVCPWNRFAQSHKEPAFEPDEAILEFSLSQWKNLGQEVFKKRFKHSPLARSKWYGLLRNMGAIDK